MDKSGWSASLSMLSRFEGLVLMTARCLLYIVPAVPAPSLVNSSFPRLYTVLARVERRCGASSNHLPHTFCAILPSLLAHSNDLLPLPCTRVVPKRKTAAVSRFLISSQAHLSVYLILGDMRKLQNPGCQFGNSPADSSFFQVWSSAGVSRCHLLRRASGSLCFLPFSTACPAG